MSFIKVSVIVTVYNIEDYIAECLESVLRQDLKEFEIICVDDASTDCSAKIVMDYTQRDKRISILHNDKNLGQASSRNRGCKVAQGKYLYIMDGDDCLKDKALSRLYSCAEENELELLTFSAEAFAEDKKLAIDRNLKMYIRQDKYSNICSGAELFVELIGNNDVHGNLCLQFMKRDFYIGNNLYGIDGLRYGEDSPFAIYMIAQRAMCIPDVLYLRRFRANSVTTSEKQACHLESLIIQFVYELQLWQSCKLSKALNEKIESYFAMSQLIIKKFYKNLESHNIQMPLLNEYVMAHYFYKYFIKETNLCCSNLSEDSIKRLCNFDTVIVYGAGAVAHEVSEILNKNNINDFVIAVTDKKTDMEKFENKRIYSIKELQGKEKTAIVIIAATKKHHDAMLSQLSNLGFSNILFVN